MSRLRSRLGRLEVLNPPQEERPRAELSYRVLLEVRHYIRRNPGKLAPELVTAVEREIPRREADQGLTP